MSGASSGKPLGAVPQHRAKCASTAISLMLVVPSATAAIETRTFPRSGAGDVPAFRRPTSEAASCVDSFSHTCGWSKVPTEVIPAPAQVG